MATSLGLVPRWNETTTQENVLKNEQKKTRNKLIIVFIVKNIKANNADGQKKGWSLRR